MNDAFEKSHRKGQQLQHQNELQANIPESSGKQAIFNLSRTCSFFYKTLSPYLFQCITLNNTAKSAKAVQYFRHTNLVANVKTLHFKPKVSGNTDYESEDDENVFPIEIEDVLSKLSEFPSLNTLITEFHLDLPIDTTSLYWNDAFDNGDKTEEHIDNAEMYLDWRRMKKLTLKTISTHEGQWSDGIRNFVYKDYPIMATSIFGSESFNRVRR